MRELSSPEAIDVDSAATMVDAVGRNAEHSPAAVAFLRRNGSRWSPVTCQEFAAQVRAVAKGLVATGVRPGDRVGLMSRTRYEWTLVDFAIWMAGGVTVPIYETSSAEQVSWILSDSAATTVVVETERHESTVKDVRPELPALTQLWQLDSGAVETLSTAGEGVSDADLQAARAGITGTDIATIIYTSGTTGRPKGCELTHTNLVGTARAAGQVLPELMNSGGSTLLFLPLAHVFGRLIQNACVELRVTMGHSADIKNLLGDLATFQPTFVLSVPRVFEKVFNSARQQAHSAPAPTRLTDWLQLRRVPHHLQGLLAGPLFDEAERVAVAYSEALQRGPVPPVLAARRAVMDLLVYSRLRAALGGQVRYAVSGGAPLGPRLGHFFRGAGITILEGYGLTETTASGTLNLPSAIKVGTVGRPAPGCTVRLADDGEILLAGKHIFRAYWNNAAATSDVVSDDGFFRTGDIGALDDDGYLTITGRKKELIVTAGGKNVAPAVLEDRLRAHPLVSQCMVVGDNRPFIACVVTIDPEAFPRWKQEHGKPDGASVAELAGDPDLLADIQAGVDEANKAVSQAEAIRTFRILPEDFSEPGGQLTPTLKVKRNVVASQFATEIEGMYTPAGR